MVSRHVFRKPFVVLVLGLLLSQGCGEIASPISSSPLATMIKIVTPIATNVTKLTRTPIPTSTLASTPTAVPLGTLVLMGYTPLVMNYDSSIWEDKSNYVEWGGIPIYPTVIIIENYLQSRKLTTCTLQISGPVGFNEPYPYEMVRLGDVEYIVTDSSRSGFVGSLYIANEQVEGGYPVVVLSTSNSESSKCKPWGKRSCPPCIFLK